MKRIHPGSGAAGRQGTWAAILRSPLFWALRPSWPALTKATSGWGSNGDSFLPTLTAGFPTATSFRSPWCVHLNIVTLPRHRPAWASALRLRPRVLPAARPRSPVSSPILTRMPTGAATVAAKSGTLPAAARG